MGKLAALVPPPRSNQTVYHGVLAGSAGMREAVVPTPPERTDAECATRKTRKLTREPTHDTPGRTRSVRPSRAAAPPPSPGYASSMEDPVALLRYVTSRLEGAGVTYMVSGSMALHFYGTPRMTRDLDVVVDLVPSQAATIVRLFEEDCYISDTAVADAIRRRSMFNAIHNELLEKVDFVVRKDEPYRVEELRRRRRLRVSDLEAWVVSPEDLVLSKLVWSKDSRSELQMRDVSTILRTAENLDRGYLERWAAALGVSDALAEARG